MAVKVNESVNVGLLEIAAFMRGAPQVDWVWAWLDGAEGVKDGKAT